MSQHDYDIANQAGSAFRSDLNGALAAIVSQNSGATAPATTYAYQWWADTTTGILKQRNAANSAWINVMTLATAYPLGISERENDFRLTLTTGVPVTTSDVTGATTIYCTPYKGNRIALYDGLVWNLRTSAQFSLALGTLTASKPYDVFCYDNSGTPTLEFLVWTNDTTRATALAYQDGVLVKSGAPTRRYLGTFYTTAPTTTEDSVANRYLWNYYHRVNRKMKRTEATGSWTYVTGTWRQVNASASNQLNFVIGVAEDAVRANAVGSAVGSTTLYVAIGIGYDSTSSSAGDYSSTGVTASYAVALSSSAVVIPSAGRHYLAWLEYSGGSTITFYGTGSVSNHVYTTGISGEVMA